MSKDLYLLLGFIGILTAFWAYIFIRTSIISKKEKRERLEQLENPPELKPAYETRARVVAKWEDIKKGGSYRDPEHYIARFMTFSADDGKTYTFRVPQDIYNRYYENDTSTLITVDDKFFYFGEGDDTPELEDTDFGEGAVL